jgi:hypothetical protein
MKLQTTKSMQRQITLYYTPNFKTENETQKGLALCRVYVNPTRPDRIHFMEEKLRAPKTAN